MTLESVQNTLNQGPTSLLSSENKVIMVPPIEEDVVLPRNAKEALPTMTSQEELNVRATTIKVLSDLTGEEIQVDAENVHAAEEVAKRMLEDKNLRPDYTTYPNETIAFLAGLVSQTNHMIVKDLSELKMYVVNNLVKAVETTDNTKEKIAGLRAIGEIDGVDAFKKKSEVTHKIESMQEVEKELIEMLRAMKAKAVTHNPDNHLTSSPSSTRQNQAQTIDADYELVKKDKA